MVDVGRVPAEYVGEIVIVFMMGGIIGLLICLLLHRLMVSCLRRPRTSTTPSHER